MRSTTFLLVLCITAMLAMTSCANHHPKSVEMVVKDVRGFNKVVDYFDNANCETKEQFFALMDKHIPLFVREADRVLEDIEESNDPFKKAILILIFDLGSETIRHFIRNNEGIMLANSGQFTSIEIEKYRRYQRLFQEVINKHPTLLRVGR